MFCPHCGTEQGRELNYCKRCGGHLNPLALAAAHEARPVLTTGMAWAVGLSTLGVVAIGLGVLFAALSELAVRGLPPDVFKVLIVFVSLATVGSVALLTWFWSQLLLGTSRRAEALAPPPAPADTSELHAARHAPLPAATAPPSVTEQTTRTLEQVRK